MSSSTSQATGGKSRGKSVTGARRKPVAPSLELTLPPGDRETPEYALAEAAVAKAQEARAAAWQASKRPPTDDQLIVARAVLRARDARWALTSATRPVTDDDCLRVETLEREARQLCKRLGNRGALRQATEVEKFVDEREAAALQAIRALRPRLTASPTAVAPAACLRTPPPVPELSSDCKIESDWLPLDVLARIVEWQRANVVLAELLPPSFRPFQGTELLAWVRRSVLDEAWRRHKGPRHNDAPSYVMDNERWAAGMRWEAAKASLDATLPAELTALLTLPSLLPPSVNLGKPTRIRPPTRSKPLVPGSPEALAEKARYESVCAAKRRATEAAATLRRSDVETVAAMHTRCASSLPAEPAGSSIRCAGTDGLPVSVSVSLTQDMAVVLCQISSAGAALDAAMVRELRALHVPFDVQAHCERLQAARLHVGVPAPDEWLAMRVDELIAAEHASHLRTRSRRTPTGRPNIGSKAARQATARHRARKQH